MSVFEKSDADLLKEAFKDALREYGAATSSRPSSTSGTTDAASATSAAATPPAPGTSTDVKIIDDAGLSSTSATMASVTKDLTSELIKFPRAVGNAYNQSMKAIEDDLSSNLAQYNVLQKAYGGMSTDLSEVSGNAKAATERLEGMRSYYYNLGNEGHKMAKSLGVGSNYIQEQFDSEAEAMQASEEVLSSLVEQHSQYTNVLDKVTKYKLPAYAKAMGVSSKDIAEVVETQIVMTGKAQTTILDDAAKFAEGLAKTTGIPLKSISKKTVAIIKDTERYGDVTAEEATRIAATLGQLGQTYDGFTGALDKFQEFGSSAETSGLISQITGGAVNLDAKELMYLASEEQEKFLPELRKSLLSGGFDKEAYLALSQAEQRQFVQAIGINHKSAISLLDRSREYDPNKIIADQAKIKADDEPAFASAARQLQLAPKSFKNAEDHAKHLRNKAMVPLQRTFLKTSDATSKLNSNIANFIEMGPQASTAYAKLLDGVASGADTVRKDIIPKHKIVDSPEAAMEIVEKAGNAIIDKSGQRAIVDSIVDAGKKSVAGAKKSITEDEMSAEFKKLAKLQTANPEEFAKLASGDNEKFLEVYKKGTRAEQEWFADQAGNTYETLHEKLTGEVVKPKTGATTVTPLAPNPVVTKVVESVAETKSASAATSSETSEAISSALGGLNTHIQNLMEALSGREETISLNIDGKVLAEHVSSTEFGVKNGYQLKREYSG